LLALSLSHPSHSVTVYIFKWKSLKHPFFFFAKSALFSLQNTLTDMPSSGTPAFDKNICRLHSFWFFCTEVFPITKWTKKKLSLEYICSNCKNTSMKLSSLTWEISKVHGVLIKKKTCLLTNRLIVSDFVVIPGSGWIPFLGRRKMVWNVQNLKVKLKWYKMQQCRLNEIYFFQFL